MYKNEIASKYHENSSKNDRFFRYSAIKVGTRGNINIYSVIHYSTTTTVRENENTNL